MATPDASPMPPVNPGQHQATDNESTMEDIQETTLEDLSTPSIHSTVAPPAASPIQSPAPPEVETEGQTSQNVEGSGASMPGMSGPAPAQEMLPSEAMDTQHVEQVPEETQVKVELLKDDPSAERAPHAIHESVPVQLQGGTTPAGSRPSAIQQPPESVPVQMANNDQGSAARIYINTKVTPVLLDGMKWVARNEPEKPLKWLSDYLAKRSADIEGT